VTDGDNSSTPLHYSVDLSPSLRDLAHANGWRYRLVSRFSPSIWYEPFTMGFMYGDGTRRYGVYFDVDAFGSGGLVAGLFGASPVRHTVTPDDTSAGDYHTHELVFDPATELVTYFFNGDPIHTWSGESHGHNGISWGAFSFEGLAAMNVHEARFEIFESGEVPANYFAGIESNPSIAPDPLTQGWTASAAPNTEDWNLMYVGPQSPDPAIVWKLRTTVENLPGNTTTFGGGLGASLAFSGNTLVVGVMGDN